MHLKIQSKMTTQKSDEMVVLADHVDIETNDKIQTKAMPPQKDPQIIYIIYLSAAAVVGACLRAYLGRFFGGDCEDQTIYDFLTPVSSKICLTTSGRALQTGGALFRDLPANVLGSFIMGLVSSKKIKIPWFHKNHALQKDDVFHVMISTGLCGSLTTFASWNTQMIVMMVCRFILSFSIVLLLKA
jgi:fluoride ion exporter CrcB/FEX